MEYQIKRLASGIAFSILLLGSVLLSWYNRQAWFGYDIYRVESVSMLPTLKPNDIVLVKLLNANTSLPQHNDIVVLRNPMDEHSKLIKRIAHLPGDSVSYIQTSTKLDEKSRRPVTKREKVTLDSIDGYFVLGDNPKHSTDSRAFGIVLTKDVVGVVVFTLSI